VTRLSLERIARKLYLLKREGCIGADRLLSTPRFIEGLCFLQAFSELPGGLEKFTQSFLGACGEWWTSLPKDRWGADGADDSVSYALSMRNYDSFEELLCKCCESEKINCAGDVAFGELDRRFPGFLTELSKFMDDHARAELEKTADTSLRRAVFLELDFARTSSPPIPMVLVADTRHGKTTAVDAYCRAWPGRARLVTVPESNHERELYAAYAEAFGMDVTPGTQTRDLKERVQFTLRNAGLFCVHDEAHWLIPVKYQKDTPPQRLNWVRTQIVDRHVPCAFFCTPQSQEETLERYVEKTHHNMEQWLGRMPQPVLISDKPTYEDLMSVARVRFSDFPQAALDELCDAADEKIEGSGARLNGEGGFKIVELAGARARFLAAQRGGKITVADIRTAVAWAGAPLPEVAPARASQVKEFSGPARGGPGRRGGAAESPHRLRTGSCLAIITVPEVTA
jgi:hypothetical protein